MFYAPVEEHAKARMKEWVGWGAGVGVVNRGSSEGKLGKGLAFEM